MISRDVSREDLLWLLGSLSSLYRLPFDAALVAQQFPPPYSLATLHEAARSLGIKTGCRRAEKVVWQSIPLPAIAFLRATPKDTRSEAARPADAAAQRRAVLILKSEDDTLHYFRVGSQQPESITAAEAYLRFDAELILVAKEAPEGEGKEQAIPGFVTDKRPFGFRWFIPELLKHKAIWRDILLASLAIQ